MPFFRRRPKRLGQDFKFVHFQRRLAGLGQETSSFHANEIAEIEKIKNFPRLRADFFLMEISLDPAGRVSKIDKVALAHVAMRGDSAGGAKRVAFLEYFPDFSNRARRFEPATKRFPPPGAKRREFLTALRNQFIFGLHASRLWNALFSHSARSLPAG